MVRKELFVLFILIAPFIFQCKKNEKKPFVESQIFDSKKEVGFVCGSAARPTAIVKEFIEKYNQEKFENIRQKLYSNDAAETLVAVLLMKIIVSDYKASLSKDDEQQIEKIKQSNAVISLCDGCLVQNNMTLKELFSVGYQEFETTALKAIKRLLIMRFQ